MSVYKNLIIVKEADALAITVGMAQEFIGLPNGENSDTLKMAIRAATKRVEEYTSRAMMLQQWRISVDWFGSNWIELPRPPLVSVDSFVAVDADGTETPQDPASYYLDTNTTPGRIVMSGSWIIGDRESGNLVIDYTVGHADRNDLPDDLQMAILMMTKNIYDGGECSGSGGVGSPLESVLNSYRVRSI